MIFRWTIECRDHQDSEGVVSGHLDASSLDNAHAQLSSLITFVRTLTTAIITEATVASFHPLDTTSTPAYPLEVERKVLFVFDTEGERTRFAVPAVGDIFAPADYQISDEVRSQVASLLEQVNLTNPQGEAVTGLARGVQSYGRRR